MRHWFAAALFSLTVLGIVGCSDDAASSAKPNTGAAPARRVPPPPPPPPPPPTDASRDASSEQHATATPQPAAQPVAPAAAPSPPPPAAAPSPPPPPAVARPSIQLATGVALAQTGPEGTMMMFSVDYEFAQGQPDTAGYIWVIERAHGAAAKREVKLTAKGTLEAALPTNWRPDDGPFHSHLEDRQGNRVSESIEMFQPGT